MRKWNVLVILFWVCTMGISTAQSLPDYLPKDGLVGWWPFNGNAKDESGNGHDGVVNGVTLTTDRFGNLNGAYEWKSNGNVGQYISIGAMASNFPQKSFSFSAWVLADAGQGANPRIINFGNVYPGVWSMGVGNSSRNYSGFWPPTGGFFYSNPVSSLTWNHLVYTTDATTGSTSFYVNGVLDTTFCCSSPDPTSSINGIWEFGKMKPTEIWGGKLDDIGIWNRALTEEEVKQLYNHYNTYTCAMDSVLNQNVSYGSVRDIDDNIYPTVKIGKQVWMAQNLKTTRFSNGDVIQEIRPNDQWQAATKPAWSSLTNDEKFDCPYGKLYNRYVPIDSRNVCPTGWKVPGKADWDELIQFLDPNAKINNYGSNNQSEVAGAALKSKGNRNWADNASGTNTSGFSAVGASDRYIDFGYIDNFHDISGFYESSGAFRYIFGYGGHMQRWNAWQHYGLSIRCIQIDTTDYSGLYPKVNTTAISNVTAYSCSSGGSITSNGGQPIINKGVVWGTSPNLNINTILKISNGTGDDAFTSNIQSLSPGTTYYVRAYATNVYGTGYGDVFKFTTSLEEIDSTCRPVNIPSANLIAAWPFCGNLKDVSGRGHHGKVKTGTEAYTTDRHGNENQALLLDGQTYIEVPHNEAFNGYPFSVSAWVKTTTGGHIVNKYSAAAWNGWTLYASSGESSGWYLRSRSNAMISQYDNFPAFGTKDNAADGDWHLLTFTVDDSLGYIYYDGILQDTQIWRGTPGKCTSGFPIRIGFYAGDNVFFKGAVDDIAVWDRRLTDEEIKNLCDKKPSDDLTVYMDTLTVSPSEEVVMPVRVKNFRDLISAQFSVRFDPKFLKFKGIENSILNPDVADLFGLSQVADGLIGFAWSDINLQPQTLADETALFNVRFELVPGVQGGDVTLLNIIDTPIDIEFMNKDLEVQDRYELGTGVVKILNGLSMQAIIITEDGKGIPAATVQVSGHAQMNVLTNREGRYIAMLDRNRNFIFTPDKVNDSIVTNGITVADVMRIKRHILRTHLLESPYKIIAADVNSDQKVTLADVNFILAMLRGELNIFPNGKLWKFVPRNHTFSDVTNPFPYPVSITIPSLSESDNLDFIGIKMGDVDNNYDATHTRSGKNEVGFHLNHSECVKGQTITIPVKVSGFDQISGFQFAMQWDPAVLSFQGLSEDHRNQDVILGTRDAQQGTLRVFWTESKGESIHLKEGDAIMHLSFVITGGAGDISNISFTKLKDLPVEVINDDIQALPVILESGKITVLRSSIADSDGVKNIVSVSPNPVLYESFISISSTQDEVISIQVYDASGKMVSENRQIVAKGNTTLSLDLPVRAGMYLVRVHHADGSLMQDVKVIRL